MGRLLVNRSGAQIPVWDRGLVSIPTCPTLKCPGDKVNRIGTLLANEFARRIERVWSCPSCGAFAEQIRFLSPSGWSAGMLHWDDLLDKTGHATPILSFGLPLTPPVSAPTHKVYLIQNRKEELRKANGVFIEDLPVGTEIATDSDTMGSEYQDYWLIQWVKRLGNWSRADMADRTYAFVDTGLRLGSGPNTLSIRTSLAT